jgi:hypothetical protein
MVLELTQSDFNTHNRIEWKTATKEELKKYIIEIR